MPKIVLISALSIAATCLAGGCGTPTDRALITYHRGESAAPAPMTVKTAGRYSLYLSSGVRPVWSHHLDVGDKFGFHPDENGGMAAFVERNGTEETIPLNAIFAREYIWKLQEK
jgi:hypothetical protein